MTIKLTFNGYWREPNIGGIPAAAGVYCVYDCTQNADKTVALHKLIYIGESENARVRVQNHEKWNEWKRHARGQLCLSYAPIINERLRVEAALIHHHKPPVNVECKHQFPFPTTTMMLDGTTALLDTYFTVHTTRPAYRYP